MPVIPAQAGICPPLFGYCYLKKTCYNTLTMNTQRFFEFFFTSLRGESLGMIQNR